MMPYLLMKLKTAHQVKKITHLCLVKSSSFSSFKIALKCHFKLLKRLAFVFNVIIYLFYYHFCVCFLIFVLLVVFFFPVIMDIMLSQSCGKILVGDPHQQIYTFRGAVNALHAVPHTHIYYLTQVDKTLTRKFQILFIYKVCRTSLIYINGLKYICHMFMGNHSYFRRASGLALRLPTLVLQYWTVVKK